MRFYLWEVVLYIEQIRELLTLETVRLWTIQDLAAWKKTEKQGILRADGRRICFEHFRPAYRWLIQQMDQRISGYPGCYPVWAWAEKPDMRQSTHGAKGTLITRIEFELPRDQVLFSDFGSWHCVLDGYYLSKSEHANKCFEAFCRQARARVFLFGSPEAEVLIQSRIKRSWEHIFDFEWLAQNPEWHGQNLSVQATTAFVPLESIKKVEYFVAR